MTTKKNTSKETIKYNASSFLEYSKKSGIALKTSTVIREGREDILTGRNSGADLIRRISFLSYIADNPKIKVSDEISASKVLPYIKSIVSRPLRETREGRVFEGELKLAGKKFNNFKGFSRTIKEIENGGIISYRLDLPESETVRVLLGKIKSIKN